MRFLVKVRVDVAKIPEFGAMLRGNKLDRSAIRGETYCLSEDPTVGYSVWEAENRVAFDALFSAWKPYYSEADIRELITLAESMKPLVH